MMMESSRSSHPAQHKQPRAQELLDFSRLTSALTTSSYHDRTRSVPAAGNPKPSSSSRNSAPRRRAWYAPFPSSCPLLSLSFFSVFVLPSGIVVEQKVVSHIAKEGWLAETLLRVLQLRDDFPINN